MSALPPIEVIESNDPLAMPRRVALVRPDLRPAVRGWEERYLMSFPHLIVRELILFQIVVIALALAAILFDAPLQGIANPLETPNPAKAPWYFLGLQELLHYFPPVVAGVLMPTLVVIALAVIPYARVNLTAGPLWAAHPFAARDGQQGGRQRQWLAQVTLPEWIMTWFVVIATILTVIGTFFRGPGWSFVWPWSPGASF